MAYRAELLELLEVNELFGKYIEKTDFKTMDIMKRKLATKIENEIIKKKLEELIVKEIF